MPRKSKKPVHRALTAQETAALVRFAKAYGAPWKGKLFTRWAVGNRRGFAGSHDEDGVMLYALRNDMSNTWLDKYEVPDTTATRDAYQAGETCRQMGQALPSRSVIEALCDDAEAFYSGYHSTTSKWVP